MKNRMEYTKVLLFYLKIVRVLGGFPYYIEDSKGEMVIYPQKVFVKKPWISTLSWTMAYLFTATLIIVSIFSTFFVFPLFETTKTEVISRKTTIVVTSILFTCMTFYIVLHSELLVILWKVLFEALNVVAFTEQKHVLHKWTPLKDLFYAFIVVARILTSGLSIIVFLTLNLKYEIIKKELGILGKMFIIFLIIMLKLYRLAISSFMIDTFYLICKIEWHTFSCLEYLLAEEELVEKPKMARKNLLHSETFPEEKDYYHLGDFSCRYRAQDCLGSFFEDFEHTLNLLSKLQKSTNDYFGFPIVLLCIYSIIFIISGLLFASANIMVETGMAVISLCSEGLSFTFTLVPLFHSPDIVQDKVSYILFFKLVYEKINNKASLL